MSEPVSICLPTYNGAEFIKEAIDSALAQTYGEIEILISDDGSTDDTLSIVDNYLKKDSRIRLISNPEKGMVNNWNNCIRESKGDWVKFLFQDDLLTPDCIEKMFDACKRQNTLVALCARDFIVHDNIAPQLSKLFSQSIIKPETVFASQQFISSDKLAEAVSKHLLQNILGEPICYLFNKNMFQRTGMFNTKLKQIVDYEFIVRLGLKDGIAFIAEPLALFRAHEKSESNSNNTNDEAGKMKRLAATHGDAINFFEEIYSNPEFQLIKNILPENFLNNCIKYVYYTACKHNGEKLFLSAMKRKIVDLQNKKPLKYNFFKYAYYRKRMKKALNII